VAEGATKLTFWGRSLVDGVVLSVGAAGVNYPTKNVAGGDVYWDTFYANNTSVTLHTTWTQYTIDATYGFPSTAVGYGPVLGGFVWYANAPNSTATITFWLDSIVWTQ
jgi:hypothetical protein